MSNNDWTPSFLIKKSMEVAMPIFQANFPQIKLEF